MSRQLRSVSVAANLAVILMMLAPSASLAGGRQCARTVTANVVALRQSIWLNRLGASIPDGMMYALARDVVDSSGTSCDNDLGKNPNQPVKASCLPGKQAHAWLREDKRPRPIVLRANEGDCLTVVFTNLFPDPSAAEAEAAPAAAEGGPGGPVVLRKARELAGNAQQRKQAEDKGRLPPSAKGEAEILKKVLNKTAEQAAGTALQPPTTVAASIHVQGMPWVKGPEDDGSYVGRNKSSLVQPGKTTSYTLFAEHEGSYLLYSTADDWTNPNLTNPAAADGGTLAQGLFGAVNIQPSESDVKPYRPLWESEWYRSQVTEQDLCLASKDGAYSPATGVCTRTAPDKPPVLDYQALYPEDYKPNPSLSRLPILNMLCTAQAASQPKPACRLNEIVHTDLTAIITGPHASNFPSTIPPAKQPPALRAIAVLPDRLQPYRELTIIYHESFVVDQAFSDFYTNANLPSLASAADNFGINYGMGGIASEILANRIGVGPMKDCTECKYEEFFLSSWVVGDPAMVVNTPATDCVDGGTAKPGCRATLAKYPDDPSNVYHSYLGDHVRFRVLHGGADLHHVHHQHAHQWLHTSNSPNADYTDSQSIGPGSSFTMEMAYYGGGNLNQTVGDSIFHCHFYAHFASGMWSMFRVYDTLQTGTPVYAEDEKTAKKWLKGQPLPGSRALPDGEIAAGTPIPGVVPMPTLPMAPQPAPVRLKPDGKEYEVELADGTWVSPQQGGVPGAHALNPGYPFFIPGIAGRRAPHPPLDFAYACSDNGNRCSPALAGSPADLAQCGSGATCDPLDGGLPRHLIVDNKDNLASMPATNNSDYSKIVEKLDAVQLAEEGTLVEQIAMKTHSQRLYPSCRPDGNCSGVCSDNGAPCTSVPGGRWQCDNPAAATCDTGKPVTYVLNGLSPKPGAPYADPCIAFDRKGGAAPNALTRHYRGADIQLDAIFNKEGWHFPQQRMISLWDDVKDEMDRKRPPQPLFFRANSGDCIEYTLANLVPNVYELDDFQVRTPTDILGQHIHLVKFDVTSSDGAGNGWNYEDGTFAPNEVTERIHAINQIGTGGKGIDLKYVGGTGRKELAPKPIKFFGDGPGGTWIGAQATIQRWYSDPIFDNVGRCSNDPDLVCTLTSLGKCGTGTCDVSAGFCANQPQTTCTAATSEARCGARGECVAQHDRTLRTVFTHDHFGPSTHQQAGLYAGLVIEPEGSVWRNNEDGNVFGGFDAANDKIIVNPGRNDGGPTSWQAVIETREPDKSKSYREFLLELQDTTLTYQPFWVPAFELDGPVFQKQFATGSFDKYCKNRQPWEPCGFCGNDGVCVDNSTGKPASPAKGCLVPITASNPCASGQTCQVVVGQLVACTPEHFAHCAGEPYGGTGIQPASTVIQSCKLVSGFPSLAWGTSPIDPPVPGAAGKPGTPGQQEIITFFGGTNSFSFNYRNEPLFPRTTDPFTGKVLADPRAGDLSYAYSSDPGIVRPNPRGAVCSNFLARACGSDGECPSGTTKACQWAGFCSDNYALCSATDPGNADKNMGKVLCANPTTATCLGACDPFKDGPGCDTAFPYKALTPGIQKGDPFTPLLRAYAGDDIQIRTLTGAHLNPHNFTIQGMNWLMQPSFVDSGWRNSQVMGISEHFELLSRVPPAYSAGTTDFLYQPGAAGLEQAGGNWGLVRAYSQKQPDLAVLPQNDPATASFGVCPKTQPKGTTVRQYEVVAIRAQQALGGPLVYNDGKQGGVLREDSNALLYFRKDQLSCPSGQPLSKCTFPGGNMPEPLVLRANAGDCIKVTLHNAIDLTSPLEGDAAGAKTVPYGCGFNCAQDQSNISLQVGFRPQLVAFDAQTGGGANVGLNPISDQNSTVQTAGPGQTVSYTWYAGNIDAKATSDDRRYIPAEFGAANLMSTDVINHYLHGLIGGLVIEPAGSTGWENAGTSALVKRAGGLSQFREFVVNFTDELGGQVTNGGGTIDAINLRSETLQTDSRFASTAACNANLDQSALLAQSPTAATPQLFCKGACSAACAFTPETPMFTACAGESVRFRVLHGGGTNTDQVFEIYGHNWSEAPYMSNPKLNPAACEAPTTQTNLWSSLEQGTTNLCGPRAYVLDWLAEEKKADTLWSASLNTWQGSRMGHGPSNHVDVDIAQAGGPFHRTGDYLYRSYPSMHFQLGVWGIFRVVDPKKNPQLCGGTLKPDLALKNQWEASKQ